jgi:phage tail-like protein
MATLRTDPLRNFKFRVSISPNDVAGEGNLEDLAKSLSTLGFAQMSGIAVTNEVIPYREGGMNTHPHKMVGQSDFAPVSLARGVFATQDQLYRWQQFIHAWQGGITGGSHGNGQGVGGALGTDYRCTVTVHVYDHPVTNSSYTYDVDPSTASKPELPKRLTVKLYNAWPGSYSISDLNAGDNGIIIQQLQLHHEGFTMDWAPITEVSLASLGQ